MSEPHGKTPPASTGSPPASRFALSRRLVRLGLILSGAILLAGGGLWFFLSPVSLSPADRLDRALKLIDEEIDAAHNLAQALEVEGYRDAAFPGGVEFVLGMAAFHQAENSPEAESAAQYTAAASHLREAEHRGLSDPPPAWTFALGKSLFAIGDFNGARSHLEDAVASYPPQRVAASLLLAEIYLDPEDRTPRQLQHALELIDAALRESNADAPQYAAAELLRGELLVEIGKTVEAEAVAKKLAERPTHAPAAIVLLAQVRIAQQRFDDASGAMQVLIGHEELDAKIARRALFLLGWAAEQRADELVSAALIETAPRPATPSTNPADEYRQRAQDYYQKTIDRFERSDEGLAALVHAGRLQLRAGAHEKALLSLGAALRMVRGTDGFHNRWLSIEQFRILMLAAWNGWNQAQHFGEAISLAQMMTPLFPRVQSDELAAKSRQRWAEAVAEELQRSTASTRLQRTPELRRLWCESGAAFARLSEARSSSHERTEALWTSIEHYFRGHDFNTALSEINELLAHPLDSLRPVALVRRGEIELNLDLLAEALDDFNEVISSSPTSPTAFTAQYLTGRCRLERDDLAGAEAAWRKILTSTELTPSAGEWRDALLALATLQCDLAGLEHRKTQRRDSTTAEVAAAWNQLQELAGSATRLFEEYLARYPKSASYSEAQYYLGKALEHQAEWQQRQWELAETDNARQQARRQRDVILERALLQFEQLRDRLGALAKEDKLDLAERTLLANVWFDHPTTCFHLGRYDDAIAEYTAAANQYPHDVRVLTAYLQMAQAYGLSGKPIEARSMLEQAQVILDQRQIPDAAFEAPTTTLTRAEWNEWLSRARQLQR